MKTETLYSRADWKYHKDRLGYDDVVDRNGRLVATVSVMDIAAAEMLQESYLADGTPKEIFLREADGCWSIYLSVPWLTPANVQAALNKLGGLLVRTFVFDSHGLPTKLAAQYRRDERAMNERAKKEGMVAWSTQDVRGGAKERERTHGPSPKRLAALLSQKLKI
jgi:hypothetical protein